MHVCISKDKLSLQTQMMYSTPFLLRVLGLLGLLLGLLGLLSVCSLKAQLHFATNSERPNFARLCAFRLGNRRPKAFLFAPQAKKILLFAFAKQDPTCLLVVVHCKVVSTLDKRNTKSHLIKLKKVCWPSSSTRGESTIARSPPRRHLFLRKAASNYLYIGDYLKFVCFIGMCASI